MKIIKGDLIKLAKEGKFDVIVHGCNCFCKMGRGIAKTIKQEFPVAYAADMKTMPGDQNKLGTYTENTIQIENHILVVVNAYTQYKYWGKEANIDYKALRSCFKEISKNYFNLRIGIPKIGAGLAGGDWDKIQGIIEEEMAGCDITLVVL
jgi:O-acetyl-ADP-ribose deacetylase (regulator of RNase III)